MKMEYAMTTTNRPGGMYVDVTGSDLERWLRTDSVTVKQTDYNSISRKNVLNTKYGTLAITKVIFNDPATIVIWSDGIKTVVKCGEGDTFDPEKGLAMAISKRFFGNKGNYCNIFKKWVPEQPKQPEKSDEEKRIREKVIDYIDKTIREIEKGREVEDVEDDDERW